MFLVRVFVLRLLWFRYRVCESFDFMFLLFDLCVRCAVSICGFDLFAALFDFSFYKFGFLSSIFFVFNFVFFDIRFPTFDFDPRFPTFDFDLARRRGEHGERQLHYITYP